MTGFAARKDTILDLLAEGDNCSPAIGSVDGNELSYGQLRETVNVIRKNLSACGLKQTDVIATSLRNSPETAAIIVALLCYFRVAPLNPAYTLHETAFALGDLEAAALIASDEQLDALAVAEQLGVKTIKVRAGFKTAFEGFETGLGINSHDSWDASAPMPDDIALLLHTSGTTSHPKLVPLTHRNICLSSRAVAGSLHLETDDRCLSIMPLFHIHGLVAGLLASIKAGACTVCAPPFQATSFFAWLESSRATWYTGVPTMHQAILARARHNPGVLDRHRLRVIRSASSPLYPAVREQLEEVFGVPALNVYGMTEAAHQIAPVRAGDESNVALRFDAGAGPKVGIMDAKGTLLPAGERGEVVLRGEQIMSGYLKPLEANEAAFSNGWFRTGDEGWIDDGGALTLTGRLKEQINSGGEKISPYEVESVLLTHPAVSQAVVFAAPHAMLGEQVMAAVVLRDGERLCERELLSMASERLTACKLPRKITFMDEIPRGATGKVQRIGMASRLNLK